MYCSLLHVLYNIKWLRKNVSLKSNKTAVRKCFQKDKKTKMYKFIKLYTYKYI